MDELDGKARFPYLYMDVVLQNIAGTSHDDA